MPVNLVKIELTPTNQGKMEISGIASGEDRFAYFVSNETVTVFDMALKRFLEEFPIQIIGRITKVFTTIVNRFVIITEEKKRSRTNLHVYKAKTDLDKSVTVHKLPFGASFRGKYQLMHSEDLERMYMLHSPGISIMTWPIYGQEEATTLKVGTNIEIENVIGGFVLNEKIFIFEKNKAGQYTSISLKTQTVNGRGDCDDDNGTMPRFAEDTFFANTAVFQEDQALDMRRNENAHFGAFLARLLPQTVTPPRRALDNWHTVVKEALVAKGGTATLRQVNDYVKETFDLTNTKNVER